jgi:L-alanine-DL-glutamate epimerase-like enolase superfamily enzyme
MPKSMKITKVTPLMLDRYLCVTVETDAGITGLGESGAWGFLEASQAAVEKFGRYLVGQDPLLGILEYVTLTHFCIIDDSRLWRRPSGCHAH